jgi:hypothetical protein
MTTKILYSEIQPCVLASCNCRESEPFLMMFRAFDQLIECGHCNTSYGVECKGNEMRAVERARTKAAAKAN